MLILWAIGATIGAILMFILQVSIFSIFVLCILAFNGFEAIYLWYCDKPYSEAWFIVGWGIIAFIAWRIFRRF